METLSTLVARAYPAQSRDAVEAVRAFGAFMRALSPRIIRNARPVRLVRGTLTVHTSNSAWANSLQLESEALLAKLKRVVPDVRVRRLIFRSGPLPEAAVPLPHMPNVARSVQLRELPDEVARELARISHDEVRAAVTRAASVGLAQAQDETS